MKLVLRFADLAFHKINNLLRLSHRIVLGDRTNDHIRPVKENYRRGDPLSFRVGDNLRFPVIIDVGHGREGGAEINSDDFTCAHDKSWANSLGLPGIPSA